MRPGRMKKSAASCSMTSECPPAFSMQLPQLVAPQRSAAGLWGGTLGHPRWRPFCFLALLGITVNIQVLFVRCLLHLLVDACVSEKGAFSPLA